MKLRNIKRSLGISLVGAAIVLGFAVMANAQNYEPGRYRVDRGRRHYETDNRGAELLRQAVNRGYQEGYQAGRADASAHHRNNWRRNEIYRSGNLGYDSHVDRSQYQYYFQQGFQKGYDDGFYSRNRYGRNNSILGNILDSIFHVKRY